MLFRSVILHIMSSLSVGGIESFVVNLLKSLHCFDVEIHVAVFSNFNPIHFDELKNYGVFIHFLSNGKDKNSIFNKFKYRIDSIINYTKLISKNKFDVIHCHNFYNYEIYVLLAKIFGIKKRIVHCHTAGNEIKNEFIRDLLASLKRVIFERFITDKIACSNKAAI